MSLKNSKTAWQFLNIKILVFQKLLNIFRNVFLLWLKGIITNKKIFKKKIFDKKNFPKKKNFYEYWYTGPTGDFF